jgi:hypothetical protein
VTIRDDLWPTNVMDPLAGNGNLIAGAEVLGRGLLVVAGDRFGD